MAAATLTAEPQPERLPREAVMPLSASARVAWRVLWTSRLVVLASGVLAVLEIGQASDASSFDPARLSSPFGYFGNLLASPFARWDSVWYLTIARQGYAHQLARTAFFPLYPELTRLVGLVTGSDLIGGVVVSLVAFAVGLLLLHRLASIELGPERAQITLLLIAFFPVSYFFSAVYTEGLYLALSAGCLLSARCGRWWVAGILGGLAASSRNSGVFLVVPVALMYLYGPRADRLLPDSRFVAAGFAGWRRLLPRYRVGLSLAWLVLIPVGLIAYLDYVASGGLSPLAPFHAEAFWYHHYHGPFSAVWSGAVAAWDGIRQLLHGPAPPVYFTSAGGDPLQVAGQNLMLFGFLVLGAVALWGTLRRLPFAYGAYCLVTLGFTLSYPVTPQPLSSLPRYELVLFPLFMWGASWVRRRRLSASWIAMLAVGLGLFTAEFATWRFVA